jgi:hypothetical protein
MLSQFVTTFHQCKPDFESGVQPACYKAGVLLPSFLLPSAHLCAAMYSAHQFVDVKL